LLFDIGSGSLANYASLKLPVNLLDKVFLTHLHADHMGDLMTLSGSWSKVGRADGPVRVWGPSGSEPRLGTRHFVEAMEEALAWDTAAGGGAINPESMKIGLLRAAHGVRWSNRPDAGFDGVQRDQGSDCGAPGEAIRPAAADAGQAAHGLPAGCGAASHLVGRGSDPAR
jgi:ribonuclease BN (tRNA processing enzyme)